MKINNNGITRTVFIFNRFVIKIPKLNYKHIHFLQGCYANWSERNYCKMFKKFPRFYEKVAPSYFCSWFGLIQIQAKCEPLKRNLTYKEKKKFKSLCGNDNKKENFGWYKNRIVCLDYI